MHIEIKWDKREKNTMHFEIKWEKTDKSKKNTMHIEKNEIKEIREKILCTLK